MSRKRRRKRSQRWDNHEKKWVIATPGKLELTLFALVVGFGIGYGTAVLFQEGNGRSTQPSNFYVNAAKQQSEPSFEQRLQASLDRLEKKGVDVVRLKQRYLEESTSGFDADRRDFNQIFNAEAREAIEEEMGLWLDSDIVLPQDPATE